MDGTVLKELGMGVARVAGRAIVFGVTVRAVDKTLDLLESRASLAPKPQRKKKRKKKKKDK